MTAKDRISVKTRPATLDDVDRLYDIINVSYRSDVGWTNESKLVKGERITKDELKTLITEQKDPLLVAFCDAITDKAHQGQKPLVLGCISAEASHLHPQLQLPDRSALIGLFAVDGEYQSKGIGGTLFRACCEHVKSELNAETAVLWVIEQRSDLQKWYEKLGFEFSGEMKDFVFPSKLIDASTKFRVYLKKL